MRFEAASKSQETVKILQKEKANKKDVDKITWELRNNIPNMDTLNDLDKRQNDEFQKMLIEQEKLKDRISKNENR